MLMLTLFPNNAGAAQTSKVQTNIGKTPKQEVTRTVQKVKTKFIGTNVSNSLLVKDDTNNNVITFLDKDYYDTSSDKNAIKDQLKNDYNNGKYILVQGKTIDNCKVSDILEILDLPANFDISKDEIAAKNKTIAYGIKKDANSMIFASFVVPPEDKDLSVQTHSNYVVDGILTDLKVGEISYNRFIEKDTAKVQDVNDDPDYNIPRYFTWSNDYIGRMSSTTYFKRVSKGSTESVWDVKQSNTTTAGYSLFADSYWTTSYVWTRLSTEGRSGATIDHGPTTTPRDGTAQVGLDGGGVSANWSWATNQVGITDLSYEPSYGRWEFNYAYRSAQARYSYQTSPGIRTTNKSGNFYLDPSQHIQFWDEFAGFYDAYTGTYTINLPDR